MSAPTRNFQRGAPRAYDSALSPHQIRLVMALAGRCAPAIGRVCEADCGSGFDVALHAACNRDVEWFGNGLQQPTAERRPIVALQHLDNLHLDDATFAAASTAPPTDPLDVMIMSQAWSWLPVCQRAGVADKLAECLVPGGILCVGHATLPGQNSTVGLLHILAALTGTSRGTGSRGAAARPSREALQRGLAFLDTNPAFAGIHWQLREGVEGLLDACNDGPDAPAHGIAEPGGSFEPGYVRDLAALLAPAGLHWACPWSAGEGIAALHLTPRQSSFLDAIPDPIDRQQLADFMRNTGLRRDIWSKQQNLAHLAATELVEPLAVVLVRPHQDFAFKVLGDLGEIALARSFYGPLLDALAGHRPIAVRDIFADVEGRFQRTEVCEAIGILLELGMVQAVNPSATGIERSVPAAAALNRVLLAEAGAGRAHSHLGSPLTGAGIEVPMLHQLLLLATLDGARSPADAARFVEAAMARIDTPASPAAARHGVAELAEDFQHRLLPIYRALMIA